MTNKEIIKILKDQLAKQGFNEILLEMSTVEFLSEKSFEVFKRYDNCFEMIEGVIQNWYNISDKEYYNILVEIVGPYNDITAHIYLMLLTYRYRTLNKDFGSFEDNIEKYREYVEDFMVRMLK